MRPRLVVMVKDPRPGRVKTRLARDIGTVAATWWMRHQLRRLLRNLRDPRWDLVLAVAPDTAITSPTWPCDLPRMTQGPGNLGDRMGRILRDRHAGAGAPRRPTCIIGADIPGITRAHVARAFRALGDHDAVVGPAPDGGYWLIGLRGLAAPPPTLFAAVRWSTPHALADTLATLPGLRVARIDTLRDVDSAADLQVAAHPAP